MSNDNFLDLVQTSALLTVCGALVYVIWQVSRLIRMAIGGLRDTLRDAVRSNQQIIEAIDRPWKRVEAIEARQDAIETRQKAESG